MEDFTAPFETPFISGILIGSRTFDAADQTNFANLSGDYNPIHLDPLQARRSISGECIVHGIHGLMFAIECLTKFNKSMIASFDAQFKKPIPLGVEVFCVWEEKRGRLSLIVGKATCTSIFVTLGPARSNQEISSTIKKEQPLVSPRNLSLEECTEHSIRELIFRGDAEVGKKLFPFLFSRYGESFCMELAMTSEIVGMQLPGLNSLFLRIRCQFLLDSHGHHFSVTNCNTKFRIIKLLVVGPTLESDIEVLFRPTSEPILSMHQIAKRVNKEEFTHVNALIIGGSRGLGATTAKAISCGGGRSTITYNVGVNEALGVQQEIVKFGGVCFPFQLSVETRFSIPNEGFNQVYYFATPRIQPDNSIGNISKLELVYKRIYVEAFRELLIQISKWNRPISVFFPSSIYVERIEKNFLMYSKFKLEGELICQEFAGNSFLRIVCPRLPRVATDQTLGLIHEELESPLDIMLPWLQRLAKSTEGI